MILSFLPNLLYLKDQQKSLSRHLQLLILFGLRIIEFAGTHTLRIEVPGEKNVESDGSFIGLGRIACYRGEIAALP
jgi:hypothetical protein